MKQAPAPLGPGLDAKMGYRPGFDGMRGVSILAIMLIHANVGWALGSFISVDVFFLLSGFLITRLLVEEHLLTGRIALVQFYIRRALRLFPAMVVVLVACAVYGTIWLGHDQAVRSYHDVFATATYRKNWEQALHEQPPYGLLDHAWTLSIEEQFYLLWPLVVIVAYRLARTRGVLIAALAGVVASACWRTLLWHTGTPGYRLYYGLDTHADGLLLGCALGALTVLWPDLARVMRRRIVRWAGPLALIVLLVLGNRLRLTSSGLDSWGNPLIALLIAVGAADIYARGMVDRMLRVAPLVAFGRISYGLYLWHWPVFLVLNGARVPLAFVPLTALRFVVSVAFAVASFFLVEQPFLRLKRRAEPTGRASEPTFDPQPTPG